MSIRTLFYTTLALLAFAGNSILCRLALGDGAIDAGSFTAIRLLSGILVLAIILATTQSVKAASAKGSWKAATMLFLYAVSFSYAYTTLETGVGALILFGSVQITMILAGMFLGNKLRRLEWLGVLIAFSGFVYLVLPSLGTPSLIGFVLMAIAGASWGFYSLLGRKSENALGDTAFNFVRTLPLVLIVIAATYRTSNLSQQGVILAIASGGIASGVGYTIWYFALRGLSTTQAAIVQLFVPVLAALGGVVFAHEDFSLRLGMSSMIILGGILVVVLDRQKSGPH